MTYNEQQQNSHILIIFKIHTLMGIKALKQYLLITKEVWIVLEAISKTRAPCLTGVCFSCLETPVKHSHSFLINYFKPLFLDQN